MEFPPTIRRYFHLIVLGVLTLLAGTLRFTCLDRPPIWGDEGATMGRICGSYQDLLDRLQYDGFGPLHYQAYWWIKQGLPLSFELKTEPTRLIDLGRRQKTPTDQPPPTEKKWLYPKFPIFKDGIFMSPFMMRLIPALAGTLMVPAMYFLAVQLTNRRVALIATTLAAFSAYLLVYSRDAKMYMHLWLCMTVSVACFLWWLRCARLRDANDVGAMFRWRRVAFLSWIASTLAAVGLHATGSIVLGLELVIFLTHLSFHLWQWRRAFTFLAGLGVCASAPLAHYFYFSRFVERVDEYGFQESGITWVAPYNRDRDGPGLIQYTASAFATSWEWPTAGMIPYIPPRTHKFLSIGCLAMLGAIIVALLPWRRLVRKPAKAEGSTPSPSTLGEGAGEGPLVPATVLPHTKSPSPQPSPLVTEEREPIAPTSLFLLLAWLTLPAYAMYCKSIREFVAPTAWFSTFKSWIVQQWPEHRIGLIVAMVLCACCVSWSALTHRNRRAWLVRMGALALIVLILLMAMQIIHAYFWPRYLEVRDDRRAWPSIWMPRYVGYLWMPFMILASILIARLPTIWLRGAVVAVFIIVNFTNFVWRITESEPPTDLIAADIITSQPKDSTFRTYTQVRAGGGAPGTGGVPSPAWNYYMLTYGGVQASPLNLRFGFSPFMDKVLVRFNINPAFINTDLRRSPQVNRISVWDKINPDRLDINQTDRLRSVLSLNWRKTSERIFDVYDHWTWQHLYSVRRREYQRTAPVPVPTTRQSQMTSLQ